MSAKTAFTTKVQRVVPLAGGSSSRLGRMYRGLLASLGVAGLLLVSSPALAATAPPLGLVQQFGVLGAASVTANGGVVTGDVGSYPTPTITGFPPSTVPAPFIVHRSADAVVQQAQADATVAYNNLAGQGGGLLADDLTGVILTPGSYSINAPNLPAGATLTLNDPTGTGIFVFNVATSMTTIATSIVTGTANPCNIYWRVGVSATLGDNFRGTVIANTSITMPTAATNLTGRAIALNGSVTMAGANNVGGCSSLVTPAVVEPAAGQVGLSKAFFPSTIAAGGVSRLAITLMNNTGAPVNTTAPLTDTLPAGMVIAPIPLASTTCGGGVVTAVAGANTVSLATGAVIPGIAGPLVGSCTVMVNVTAASGGSYINNLGVGALTVGALTSAATSATLTVLAVTGIPTLSEWAMIMLAALLAITGFVMMRRQES